MKQSFKLKVILISVIIIVVAVAFFAVTHVLAHKAAQGDFGQSLTLFFSFVDGGSYTISAEKYHNIIAVSLIIGAYILAVVALLIMSLKKKVKAHAQDLERLEQYRQLWQTFINADVGLVFLKDENLSYIFVNDAFAEAYGHSQNEIVDHSDFDFMDEALAETHRKIDLEVLEQHTKITVRTFSGDGGSIYKTTKFPVRMLNGSFGVGAYIYEVTEEEKHIQEQMRSFRRNGVMLEMLSRNFSSNRALLSYAFGELLKLSGSQYGNIFLYDEDTKELSSVSRKFISANICKAEDKSITYKLPSSGVLGESINRREPVIVNDTKDLDLWGSACPDECPELKNFVSVPVLFNDRIVVVAAFGNKESGYEEADVNEMTLIMSGIWNAGNRRNSMETLAYERSKYYYTLLSIGDGVMVIDRNKKIEFLNTVACTLTGWKKEEAMGLPYKDVFVLSHEQEDQTIDDPIEKVFLTGKTQELGNHAILTSRDGTKYYLEDSAAPIPNDKGEIAGVVLVFRDTTEKKEQRQKIEYMSFHDSLTGLYNRRFCEEELRRIDTERNLPISILMGDVNGLKLANDIFDHAFGDQVLKKVANAMRKTCRSDDIIARWGGDEFIILLPKTDTRQAESLVERIRNTIEQEQLGPIKVSISIGFDTKLHKDEDLMQVLGSAEEKMYSIKSIEREVASNWDLHHIITTLFNKNNWEEKHSQNVSQLSRKIGAALGLSESDVNIFSEAGRLHDIGKIILEPELMIKDADLSPAEINKLRKHPVVGYRILHAFDQTMELAEAVLAHHEKWDGSGYPKGLKGEQIPLAARVIAVAEAYDRFFSSASGEEHEKQAAVAEEIKGLAGIHFDPHIVSAFLSSINKMKSES